jgi:hypothetical protein
MSSKIHGLGQVRRNGNGASELGLAVLSALSIAGIHSAINPSFFTLKAFAKKPEERANAIQGLWIGLGLGTAASVAIYAVFRRLIPAIISEASALALFGIGMAAVKSNGVEEPTMAPKIDGVMRDRLEGFRSRMGSPKFILIPTTGEFPEEAEHTYGSRIPSDHPGRSAEDSLVPGGLVRRVGSRDTMHVG